MSTTPPLPQPSDNPTLPEQDPSTSIPIKGTAAEPSTKDDDTAPSESPT